MCDPFSFLLLKIKYMNWKINILKNDAKYCPHFLDSKIFFNNLIS